MRVKPVKAALRPLVYVLMALVVAVVLFAAKPAGAA
jgi:hypothetical protein